MSKPEEGLKSLRLDLCESGVRAVELVGIAAYSFNKLW